MTSERVEPTKERLKKPGADPTMVEIGEGRTRRMVRKISVDTIDRMIARNRLQKSQEAASREIERLRTLIGIPLSASRCEPSIPGSGEESQRAAQAFAEWQRLMKALSGDMSGHVLVWVFVEGESLETIGFRLNPKLTSQSRKIETGDSGVLKALDAAAAYFGY